MLIFPTYFKTHAQHFVKFVNSFFEWENRLSITVIWLCFSMNLIAFSPIVSSKELNILTSLQNQKIKRFTPHFPQVKKAWKNLLFFRDMLQFLSIQTPWFYYVSCEISCCFLPWFPLAFPLSIPHILQDVFPWMLISQADFICSDQDVSHIFTGHFIDLSGRVFPHTLYLFSPPLFFPARL